MLTVNFKLFNLNPNLFAMSIKAYTVISDDVSNHEKPAMPSKWTKTNAKFEEAFLGFVFRH